MIPRTLSLRNFMCYREGLPPLEFDGITIACLAGENGAGKSALLDALTWALWGEARLGSDDDLIALGATEMEVDLTFTLDGQDYRVIRKRSKGRRAGQSLLEFQVRGDGGWRSITPGGVRETQEAITRTLRMSYDLFANSAYLRQGRADEFTRKEPARRKQVLAEILGLKAYEELEARARERARDLDGRSRGVEGQIATLERQAEKRDLAAAEVAAAVARVAESEARAAAAQEALDRAAAQAQALEQTRALRDERLRQVERSRTERDRLAAEVLRGREGLARAESLFARRDEIVAGAAALQAARAELRRLDGLRDAYDALQLRRAEHVQSLRDAETHLRAELRGIEQSLRDLRDRAAKRPALVAQADRLAAELRRFEGLDRELQAARAERVAAQERIQAGAALQLRRAELQSQVDRRRESLVATREELKRSIRASAERVKDEPAWRAELERLGREQLRLRDEQGRLEELRRSVQVAASGAGELRAACAAIKGRGDELNQKIERLAQLGPDASECPLCGSPLDPGSIAHVEQEYERQRAGLRAQYSAARREAEAIEAELAAQQQQVAELERRASRVTEVAARIARLEGDIQGAQELRRRLDEDQRTLDDVQMQLVKGDFERGVRNEITRVEAEIAALGTPEALAREQRRLDDRVAELESRRVEQRRVELEAEALQEKIRAIDAEDPAIYEHEQRSAELSARLDLGDFADDERRALARVDGELAALGYAPEARAAAARAEEELAPWDAERARLERAEEWVATNEPRLRADERQLLACEAEIVAAEDALRRLDDELRALAGAPRARDEAAAALRQEQAALMACQKTLGEWQAEQRRAEQAAADLDEARGQLAALAHRKGLFDELGVALGKKGVQAMLIETAIPEIEREANRLLGRMTDNQLHLTFETQRDTKKGDVAETLEIKIADGLGTRVYDAYSGGEAFRLDFAIRIALAKLLARRAGARLETLVIDEGFGSQDTRGRERLVEAITSVQHDFRRILVITHIQELKDMFPLQIEITKTPQGSVWSIA